MENDTPTHGFDVQSAQKYEMLHRFILNNKELSIVAFSYRLKLGSL